MASLSHLIFPLDKQEFLLNYWEKKHLFIKNDNNKFLNVYSYEDLTNYLNFHAHSLQYPEIRVTIDSKHVSPEEYHETIPFFSVQNLTKTKINPEKLNELISQKASLILSDIQEYNDFFQDLSSDLSAEIERKINVTLFYSSDGLNSFKNHCDPESAFILQLKGKKNWTIYEKPDEIDNYNGEPLKVINDYILEEGDVLYLPKGVWHNAKAFDGNSLSATITMTSVVIFNLYVSLLESFLLPRISELDSLYKDLPIGKKNLTEIRDMFLRDSIKILNNISVSDLQTCVDDLLESSLLKNGRSTFKFPFNIRD